MANFFQTFKNSNGTYTTVQWTPASWATGKLLGYLGFLIVLCWILFFIPILFMFLYFFTMNPDERFWQKRVAIVAGCLFLVDYHLGVFGAPFLQVFIGPTGMFWLARLEVALILVNLLLIIFERKLYAHLYNKCQDNWEVVKSMGIIAVYHIIVITYLSKFLLENLLPQYILPSLR